MNDTLAVGIGHGLAHTQQGTQRALPGPTLLLPPPFQQQPKDLLQLPPTHQTHGEEHTPLIIDPQLVYRHDARMIELPRDLRLLQKARQRALVHLPPTRSAMAQQHLHGQPPPEIPIPDLQHRPHAPAPHLPPHSIARPARHDIP